MDCPDIPRTTQLPPLDAPFDDPMWNDAPILDIAHFHPESTNHRPRTQVRVLHNGDALQIIFRVEDRFVRSVQTEYQAQVCEDSCVEFFAQPLADQDYLNFEFNAGGTLHVSRVHCPLPANPGDQEINKLGEEERAAIAIHSSMPKVVDPEITEPTTWTLCARIPFWIFARHTGTPADPSGTVWRVNFYKCGDKTSHPHWATWAPIGDELNFHRPEYFADLRLQ